MIITERMKVYLISIEKMKGIVEIGYGINEGYENKEYMTEAVRAIVKWASEQPNVNQIEAEAEECNFASIRVLDIPTYYKNIGIEYHYALV